VAETVAGLADCERKAADLGRVFLNFEAEQKLCFTSLTCDKKRSSVYKWQVFKLDGTAPSPSNRKIESPSIASPALHWVQVMQPKMKCERSPGESNTRVQDLAACQRLAESKGSAYVNFDETRLKCFTSATCIFPKATFYDWRIYRLEERPSKWVAILEPRTKCERPAGEAPESSVDLAACQEKAEAQGSAFLNFEKGRKLCYTSTTCDRPVKSIAYDWQVYKLH
jgi:hypothetical protein